VKRGAICDRELNQALFPWHCSFDAGAVRGLPDFDRAAIDPSQLSATAIDVPHCDVFQISDERQVAFNEFRQQSLDLRDRHTSCGLEPSQLGLVLLQLPVQRR
jgi:hypothetical protein